MGAARRVSVLIIGAGFGGIGVAAELRRHGFDDITIVEKAHDLGGVWRDNTYPGAACDVPSPLYSYSYEQRNDWPQRYSGQAAIHDYLREVADLYELTGRIEYGTEITAADFDETAGTWTVRTADGGTRTTDVLISAVGQLSRPQWPAIAGIDSFSGPAFHSAQWDHEVDLAGKRVAVIGTGASAVQLIPQIQPIVGQLTVFQRTPAWVLPRFDTDFPQRKRARLSRSPRMAFERAWWWAVGELASLGLVEAPIVARGLSKWALHNLNSNVGDPTLREILTPDYPLGCKRTLFSSDYYPALDQPNVTVTTDAISEITPAGVRTAGGVDHPADVIIYGTGFKATEFLWPMRITGREGKELSKVWADGAHAYYGISVPEFPNFFMVYGPNTNLGSNSIIHMIESQSRHIRQAVRLLAEDPGTVIEVRADTERYYNDQLQRRLERTPWNYCTSWYRTASGKITNNWPGGVTRYRRRAAHLDRDDYSLTHIG